MNVLSLFDGISCARVSLEKIGVKISKYYACEIDANAIKVSAKNYPDIVRLGDVRQVKGFPVDLLIGGSPCQDLSIGKKERKGLEGERSSLFWEYVRLLKECKPTWFVLENVASMPVKDKEIISRELGVVPVMIDASLVSAQSRKRLFWTNLPVVIPADRGITISDVLEEEGVGCSIRGRKDGDVYVNRVEIRKDKKVSALTSSMHSKLALVCIGRDVGRRLNSEGKREDGNKALPISRRIELRKDGKSGTLTSVVKDNLVVGTTIRKLTPVECERLQGLPDGYTSGISDSMRYRVLGNAFNVEVLSVVLHEVAVQESVLAEEVLGMSWRL